MVSKDNHVNIKIIHRFVNASTTTPFHKSRSVCGNLPTSTRCTPVTGADSCVQCCTFYIRCVVAFCELKRVLTLLPSNNG